MSIELLEGPSCATIGIMTLAAAVMIWPVVGFGSAYSKRSSMAVLYSSSISRTCSPGDWLISRSTTY
ncbi:MAG: hypothetical protein A3G83_05175 [Betaproteobacteria bacterium RIFCSPLOWO2_12_FULL_68_20]|nr:MAG: hypothetical protein A3G83_05175 [Betaproteobacteria bacterium RIFCSPLOWO2_12_FULL_68_20]